LQNATKYQSGKSLNQADRKNEALCKRCAELEAENQAYVRYIRDKINYLLDVIGTKNLVEDELDDFELIKFDPIGIVARSFQQILTNLNQTIDDLREAKNELQAIFDATGVGISIIDRDFVVERCNEKQREMLVDAGVEEVIGRHCFDVYCDRNSPTCECPAMDSFKTGKPALVREVEKKGRWFQLVTTPFSRAKDGSISRVIEVSMDISEKKKVEDAEKALREFCQTERRKLATVIESLSEGLLVVDDKACIVSGNLAADEITEQRIGENYKRPLTQAIPELVPLLSSDGNNVQGAEILTHTRRGDDLLLSVNVGSLSDNNGRTTGYVLTFRDITEEKKRAELYNRTEKLAAIGQLSAGVAHELNTPLGSVLGYARLLLKAPSLPCNLRCWVEIIAEQAKKSSTIIQELLRFARQSNPAHRCLKDCLLNDVIQRTLPVLSTELDKRNIELVTDLNPVPTVVADPQEIEQLVLNLTMNAIQAIDENGSIRICTLNSGSAAVMTIADSGPGIPEEIRFRIFDPFFTTKAPGEGTGLGLSLCSGIVSDLGGTIDINSKESAGAMFIVTLPASGATSESGVSNG
jgi:two-component system NtrC family sensor kinase